MFLIIPTPPQKCLASPSFMFLHHPSTQHNNNNSTAGTFPLFRIVVAWCSLCSLSGAVAIYLFEGRRIVFFNCLFFAVSATTNSGLATVDILSLSSGSWTVLCVIAFAGSSVLLSIVPVVVRMHYLEG